MNNGSLCPSAPLYAGSKLLGVVKGENEVDILSAPLEINDVFVQNANQGSVAEQKFRFVNKCVKSGCGQWTGSACGVIERVISEMEAKFGQSVAPACGIRPQCRWFQQEGYNACKVCPTVRYI